MAASSSQGQTNWRTPGDLIICSIEDINGSDFKKFRNKLSDFSYGDKPPIPRGKLENADCITTKDLLMNTYGEEGALDVTIAVLVLNSLLGPANDLQERRTQNAKLKTTTTSNKVTAKLKPVIASNRLTVWKKEYMGSTKEDFQQIKEYNARRGETVSLQKQYTNLQLIKGPQIMEENMREMLHSGKLDLPNLKKISDEYFPTTIQKLFDPDKNGFIPKIVVLQGPAGIGKTMTSRKIMLDWASGNLYQDMFNFVFHLSCRELNTITGPISLLGLLCRTCKLQCSDDLVSILKDPGNHRKLLFIVDGFDELRWTLEKKSEVCHDIFEETHKDLLLQRLLRKQVLKQSSLIITTRPLALENLYSFVEESRDVEVLGLTEEGCKEYIHNFFKNKNDADKALSIIKDNDVLYTMCAVPIVCWIVCTVLKPQIKQDLDLLQYKTATSVYLLYLKGLIKYHCRDQPTNACLKKLCALAKEGILNQKILFEMEDLNRHGLSLSEVESVFLNENLFHLDIDTQTCYSFIHLSVQEFLAALYYVLDDGSGNEDGTTGPREGTSIPEICKGNSLSSMCKEHPHLALAVRFLFGLLNEKDVKQFSKSTGINISLPDRQAMEEWFMGECLLKDSNTGNTSATYSTEAILYLYETQDKDIIRRIISNSSDLKLIGELKSGSYCSRQLCYCLKTCDSLQSLSVTHFVLEPKHLQMLSSLLHGCQQLRFDQCCMTPSCCDYLRSLLITNRSLISLDLSWNGFMDSGIKLLCEGLKDPGCTLQELIIHCCGVSYLSCDSLQSVLIANRSLTKLDLSWNQLDVSGIKLLCEGLRHPGSTLQELKFFQCNLNQFCCDDLYSILITNRSLTSLDLSSNHLMDSGIEILCEGLRDPGCTLRELNIGNCHLTYCSCSYLRNVLIANRSLTKLGLSSNYLQDSGIKRICKGLKHPDCTLQELIISHNYLTPLSCGDLRSVLIANRSLTKLDLSLNLLEDSGIKLICEGLKHPDCTLQDLRFDYCRMTFLCCEDLCSAIATNHTLSTLETSFKIDEKVSESDCCFEGLRRLGCMVYKKIRSKFDGLVSTDHLPEELEIKYRRPSLQMGPC